MEELCQDLDEGAVEDLEHGDQRDHVLKESEGFWDYLGRVAGVFEATADGGDDQAEIFLDICSDCVLLVIGLVLVG